MTASVTLEKLLKIAGLILLGGLVVITVTLLWSHPLSFLISLGVGNVLIAGGVILYLYAIVSR
jgi:hypothetical protein